MKKIIAFIVVALFFAQAAFAQDSWVRVEEMEEIFALFEIEVEIWMNEETGVINFEDTTSRNFDEALFQISYIMTAFDFVLVDQGLSMEDSIISAMIYSYFIPNESYNGQRNNKYNESQYHRYDITMERQWLIDYFNSSRRIRDDLLFQLFDEHYSEWFPQQKGN